jgi:hypothetical protein
MEIYEFFIFSKGQAGGLLPGRKLNKEWRKEHGENNN